MPSLEAAAKKLNWPAFRLQQIHHAREIELKTNWEEITNLSKSDREWLTTNLPFDAVKILTTKVSSDGSAVKWLLELAEGEKIETVLLLHTGKKKKLHLSLKNEKGPPVLHSFSKAGWGTVCLSSQIGCPIGCTFCATGQMGFTRNLTTEEILDQFLVAAREAKRRGLVGNLNVVFMGMGEPLLNLANVIPAIQTLTAPKRFALAPQRITVSTSGIVPELKKLRAAKVGDIGLALSLHAPLDALRTQLMPINQTFPLAKIFAELREWEKLGTDILYEYILIDSTTATPECERELVKLLKQRHGKLNLIPINPVPGSAYRRPPTEKMRDLRARLEAAGLTVTLRHTKGDDIAAACGQLKTETSA